MTGPEECDTAALSQAWQEGFDAGARWLKERDDAYDAMLEKLTELNDYLEKSGRGALLQTRASLMEEYATAKERHRKLADEQTPNPYDAPTTTEQ